jgi:hypothetical protein
MTDQEKKIAKHAKAKREEAERRRKGEVLLVGCYLVVLFVSFRWGEGCYIDWLWLNSPKLFIDMPYSRN